tara:strand:- start:1221 stop:2423 length:1203 start_codon:yes stop_codon:yes gene_type:complete
MEIEKPYLFLEVNDEEFVFLIVKYDEDFNFKVIHSVSAKSEGILKGRILDIEASSNIIKENLTLIEKKIDFIFENVIIINEQENFSCVNISGFKKLGGSQVIDENISYILNNIKKLVLDNEPNKSLVHLFNSSFILDNVSLKNPPIGLHGEFYNQHLTFLLLPKNDLKNLKLVLNNCHLNIERIIFKPFILGLKKIIEKEAQKTFAMINIGKNKTNVSIFDNFSFIYSETFHFGTDLLMRDVSKVCSLDLNSVEKIFRELNFNSINVINNEQHLDEKYFSSTVFRKISLQHINEIVVARIDEIADLIYKNNINLKNLKNEIKHIYFSFEDLNVLKNLRKNFEKIFEDKKNIVFEEKTQDEHLLPCLTSAELIGKGWEREAIPTIQTKKSIISRIFSAFFK